MSPKDWVKLKLQPADFTKTGCASFLKLINTSSKGMILHAGFNCQVRGFRHCAYAGYWLLPGFATLSFVQALIAAVVIAVLGFLAESIRRKSPAEPGSGRLCHRGGHLRGPVWSWHDRQPDRAALAAVIIGIVDLFVPTELR